MSNRKIFLDGILKNNPVFIQLVGMCSVLGITTSVSNAFGMGFSVTFVLVCSNMVISLLRKFIPDKIRIPSFVVIIATFVTIVDMFINAFLPNLYKSLGLFIPLIVVNCIILARAESFAFKNTVFKSFIDGISQGLGYTLALFVLASIREVLGNGTFLGYTLFLPDYKPLGIASQAPGAFIILGLILPIFITLSNKITKEGGED